MYVIRRVYEVKPGMARRYATIAMKMSEEYEASGQRSTARIYFNGGTIPGAVSYTHMTLTTSELV